MVEKKTLERVLLIAKQPEIHKELTSFLSNNAVKITEINTDADLVEFYKKVSRSKIHKNELPDLILIDSNFSSSVASSFMLSRIIPYAEYKTLLSKPCLAKDYVANAKIEELKAKYSLG